MALFVMVILKSYPICFWVKYLCLDGVWMAFYIFKNLDDQLFVDMKVQNFNMTHGQFGDVEVLWKEKRDNINVKTLVLSFIV